MIHGNNGAATIPISRPTTAGDISVSIASGPDQFGRTTSVVTVGDKDFTDKVDVSSAVERSNWAARQVKSLRLRTAPLDNGIEQTLIDKLLAASTPANDGRKQIEILSFDQLEERYPAMREPVIDGWLRLGETGNIISVTKAGKSWLVYYIALCVIVGRSLFDRFPTHRGRVLLIDNELHGNTLKDRIPHVAAAMDMVPADWKPGLDTTVLRGNLTSIVDLRDVFERVRGKYKLIILDAKYRFAPEGTSENDNSAEARFYNLLDQYAELSGAAILLVHHSTKGNQSDKRVTDVGAGAGSQSRAADAHLILREHEEEGTFVLDGAIRSFPPMMPVALKWQWPLWEPAEEVDPTKLLGRLSGSEQKQQNRDREGIELIRKALKQEGWLTRKKLLGPAEMGLARLERLLGKMEFDKLVESRPVNASGNATLEYTLTAKGLGNETEDSDDDWDNQF